MPEYLEVWERTGLSLHALEGERVSLGRDDANDVVLSDPKVSNLHALLEHFQSGWSIRDLGSRNGTSLNGRAVTSGHIVHDGDELRLGSTRIVARFERASRRAVPTMAAEPAPQLTRRERDVLLALCKSVLSSDIFAEPASIREIAAELYVTEAAVKQHLAHLYDKFGVYESGTRRRARLAEEAIKRGAVTVSDLRAAQSRDTDPASSGSDAD